MREFDRLTAIMKRLRHPVTGCPWDREQNVQTLKEYVLEETFELLEAIESENPDRQREELGDLLLQIVFISRISQEANLFDIRDVINGLIEKLVNRHPHVFGDVRVNSPQEVKSNWEKIKSREKEKKSIISDYSAQLPSLQNAKRVSEQAANAGFDWQDPLRVIAKVEEELNELKEEIKEKKSENYEEEVGDILFSVVNLARHMKINPEFALKRTTKKFTTRFRMIEKELEKKGEHIWDASLEEMESLWEKAKKKV